ncbi:MAG: hypothetical protein SFV32_11220 [Opitutaceae bacterium]|nr:hypothetical protein [Opitutaceae bacterium]
MDWRSLARHDEDRGAEFYLSALRYGQYLWQKRLPARAILCLDRAMGADVTGLEPPLKDWPMPYAAMAWFLENAPEGEFIGNPRVHFQHYADRMNEPRKELRQARAWACWAIARAVRPDWPADPRHAVREPTLEEIHHWLVVLGHPGEPENWRSSLKREEPGARRLKTGSVL